MANLQEFKTVRGNLKEAKKDSIVALHKFVFASSGDRNNRKRLRNFEGFTFQTDDQEYNDKLEYVQNNLQQADLIAICHILGINYNVENLPEYILQNLKKGALLSATVDSEDDDQNDDDDDEVDEDAAESQEDEDDDFCTLGSSIKSDKASNCGRSSSKPIKATNQEVRFAINFRDVEESLNTFDGSNGTLVDTWLEEFEETANMMKWDDFQKFVYGKKLLKGVAALFVKGERGLTSWPKLKTALSIEFRTEVNSAELHKQLATRKIKKEENVYEYFLHMKELASRGSIEDAAIIQYTINGIVDSSYNKTVLYGAKNLKEFKEKLRSYEAFKNNSQQHAYEKTAQSKSNQSKNASTEIKCYNCGKNGHRSADCRNKEKGVKCFSCNSFGHYAKDCKKNKNEVASNTRCVSLVNERMMKKLTIDDKNVKALFDTGSKFNLITEKIYKQLQGIPLANSFIQLTGFGAKEGKNVVKPIGKINTIIHVDNQPFNIKLLVVPDKFMDVDMILGEEFCTDKEVRIDNEGVHFSGKEKHSIEEIPDIMKIGEITTSELDVDHHASQSAKTEIKKMIEEYKPENVKSTSVSMKIVLHDETAIFSRPRRLPFAERQFVEDQIDKWLCEGIIEPSESEFSSPIVLVKKRDGTPRLCIDYRKINKVIIKDRFPLPLIEDQLDNLQGASIFSTLDLTNGFFHVSVDEDSRKYTSFVTHNGQYQFKKVPFGLCNSPSVFQRFINAIFRELSRKGIALPYIDDLIIPAKNEEEGLRHLREVLKVCSEYGLNINIRKCQFLKRKVEFLGHVIEDNKISPSPRKIEALVKYKMPENPKQVQSFLGLASYFRKFIRDFAIIAKPLSDLLKHDAKFEINVEQVRSFNLLKQAMMNKPVLGIFQQGLETEVHTDASKDGYGAVLFQKLNEDGQLHPIYYMSKKTTPAESKYSSYELEILAVVEAVKKFRVYILGLRFKLVTDCNAFAKTLDKKDLCTRVARWILLLQEFDYIVEHRAGARLPHVDALSRYAVLKIDDDTIFKIQQAQREDDELKVIIEILKEKATHNDYFLKNGVLYKLHDDCELVVAPSKMQQGLIVKAHERGHFGVRKVKDLLSGEYYIPKLEEKIKKVISCCVACLVVNRKKGRQEGELSCLPKGELPLMTYHIDFLGPLESSAKNYKHVFVVVDGFTKYCWIYATKTTSATCAIAKLKAQSIVFGNPEQIISDRGAAFTSEEFKQYCYEENIRHLTITTGLPRANGQVERLIAVISATLAKASIDDPTKWYKHLEIVQQYINSTISRSTNYTPFELLTGVKMRLKEDLRIKSIIEEEFINQFNEERHQLRQLAKEQIMKLQQDNKRRYDLRRKPAVVYRVGDLVAIKRTQFGGGLKLKAKYLGPYRIVKCKPKDTYDVIRIGSGEGPIKSSSCAEYMKPWPNDYDLSNDDPFGANEHAG